MSQAEKIARPTEQTHAHGAPGTRARILSASYDHGLLLTREKLLGTAAHEVVSVGDLVEAVQQVANQTFDLVIVCHTIHEEDVTVLINVVRKRSRTPILVLSRRHYILTQAQRSEDGNDGPSAFLRAVTAILEAQPGDTPVWLSYDPEKRVYRVR